MYFLFWWKLLFVYKNFLAWGRTRHTGHCWRSKDEIVSDVLLWTPTYGQSKAGRPARTFIQQLCDDTGCNPEDLPKAMNDRETWRERVRDIRASRTSWWWWLLGEVSEEVSGLIGGLLSFDLVGEGDFYIAHLTGHAVDVISIFFSRSIFRVEVWACADVFTLSAARSDVVGASEALVVSNEALILLI